MTDDLHSRVAALESLVLAQQAQIAELKVTRGTTGGESAEGSPSGTLLTRRGMLKAAALGVAGVAGAGALMGQSAEVAHAASGPTEFDSTTDQAAVYGSNTFTGPVMEAPGYHGAGVFGSSTQWYGVYGSSGGGIGVHGETTATGATGVEGTSIDGQGVYGIATSGNGVIGAGAKSGVIGLALLALKPAQSGGVVGSGINPNSGGSVVGVWGTGVPGVRGEGAGATLADGVQGQGAGWYSGVAGFGGTNSDVNAVGGGGGAGVFGVGGAGTSGTSNAGPGVVGLAYGADNTITPGRNCGVVGTGVNSGGNLGKVGVLGLSDTNIAILGTSTSGYGVEGISTSNYGSVGHSTSSHGLGGYTTGGYGFVGQSTNSVGMRGSSIHNYGTVTSGGLAPIRLLPATTAGPPPAVGHLLGELYVDKNGALYYFNGTVWKQVA